MKITYIENTKTNKTDKHFKALRHAYFNLKFVICTDTQWRR